MISSADLKTPAMCSKEGETPTEKDDLKEKDVIGLEERTKEKRKKKHREKRKRSCSTDSTSSVSSHKRHKKKKKKKKKDDDPPSPRVNPIFLWVKQDHTKIVEVLCEDYDIRNRIRLTKTAGGWVAIPRTNRLCSMTSREDTSSKEDEDEEKPAVPIEEVKVEVKEPPEELVEEVKKEVEPSKEAECTEVKCCPEANVDENHNNEVIPSEEHSEICKSIEDEVEEVKVSPEEPEEEEQCKSHQEDCVNLMNELADMCFVENLKEEVEEKDLHDIYTFVPSPAEEKDEVKNYTPVHEIKKPPTPEPSPINLVVHSEREEVEPVKQMKMEPLKQSDLDSLDILWRLPEGTTISHSKPLVDTKPGEQRRTPQPKPPPTFSQPVQEEPLNLGKPKPKEEKKREDSKLMELLKTEEKLQSNPLDQLKEVLSDPDLTVPDPLLVPRARLPALIANPAKEIPRLLAQKREVKYPKVDPDLMEVSLAHLQSILQKSGKEDELKLYQQQMMSGFRHDKMDPTTAALNQMLWLPYLSQLEAKHNQELMAMLYPHYIYPQSYVPPPPPPARYPYPRPAWPRAETSKPPPPKPESPKPKPKLKVRDLGGLVEPNQRNNLLKFDPTPQFLPPVGVPPNSNLWHPLFSSPDGKYTSRWNWTTPVTVSGE